MFKCSLFFVVFCRELLMLQPLSQAVLVVTGTGIVAFKDSLQKQGAMKALLWLLSAMPFVGHWIQ